MTRVADEMDQLRIAVSEVDVLADLTATAYDAADWCESDQDVVEAIATLLGLISKSASSAKAAFLRMQSAVADLAADASGRGVGLRARHGERSGRGPRPGGRLARGRRHRGDDRPQVGAEATLLRRVSRSSYDSTMEILKVQLNDKQTLIAYCRSSVKNVQRGGKLVHETENYVDFKVGPDSANRFVDCSPDAAMALLAMLGQQEKQSTP